MAYTLIGSERSPFVRACRMLMIQHQIPFDFRILNFVDNKEDALALAEETPINKVPVLLDGKQRIFDSRVIVEYLSRKHGITALSLDEENSLSAIYSCMDITVMLFLMARAGYDIYADNFFLKRNRERIVRNLEFLAPWAQNLDQQVATHWNYASMSLFAYLDWAEKRAQMLDVASYPVMSAFRQRFGSIPAVLQTSFA